MRAVEEARLPNTSTSFQTHIERCLGCRACEAACPAGVEYGQLLEAARAEVMRATKKPTGTYRLLKLVLRHIWLQPKRLRAAFALARLVRDSGLARLLLKTNIPRELSPQFEFALALLDGSRGPRGVGRSTAGTMPANPDGVGNARTPVFLFRGCVTDGLFRRVNEATSRVLQANGCSTQSPESQVCCGALHAHAGDLDGARRLARQNIDAFEAGSNGGSPPPIVTNAGGCGAMLVSYAHLLADDVNYAEAAKQFSARVRDIGQQLPVVGFRNGAAVGFERTTYDASCHLLYGQHAADESLGLLWAIPDLNFALLKESDVCCGGAGVYNLLEPELSRAVLDEKLKHIRESGAEVLATGNPGCHMQIVAGAKLAAMELRVCHPVELLDESYARAGFYNAT